jgi:hypothetical protein
MLRRASFSEGARALTDFRMHDSRRSSCGITTFKSTAFIAALYATRLVKGSGRPFHCCHPNCRHTFKGNWTTFKNRSEKSRLQLSMLIGDNLPLRLRVPINQYKHDHRNNDHHDGGQCEPTNWEAITPSARRPIAPATWRNVAGVIHREFMG